MTKLWYLILYTKLIFIWLILTHRVIYLVLLCVGKFRVLGNSIIQRCYNNAFNNYVVFFYALKFILFLSYYS